MQEKIIKLKKDQDLYQAIIVAKVIQQNSLLTQEFNSYMPSDHWEKIERVALDLKKLRSGARSIQSKITKLEKELIIMNNSKLN